MRAKQFVASTLDVHQTFETLIGRAQMPAAFLQKLDGFQYTGWSLYGLHLAMHEPARLTSEAFDPNIGRTLKWSLGAESMEDLMAAHKDVMAGKVPSLVQFGCGPLSVIDPTQAPPGKHTQYAWHVMPLNPDIGEQGYEDFEEEFAEKIIEVFARYRAEHDAQEHHRPARLHRPRICRGIPADARRRHLHGRVQRRAGDVQPFRLSHADRALYMAGSAAHPGGAISGGSGYISAGIIARELGLKLWWKPWDAREALSNVPAAASPEISLTLR